MEQNLLEMLAISSLLSFKNLTLVEVKKMFKNKGCLDVRCVTLLDKPSRRVCEIEADYVGFEVPNEFVVGYGLDYNQKYRNLPFVGVLKPEIYQ